MVALTYRATVDQPQRFVRFRAVGAHVGLTPKRYQSGETDYEGGVSKCGDALLRTMLYEAAHVLLTSGAKWSWLKAWGVRDSSVRAPARHVAFDLPLPKSSKRAILALKITRKQGNFG